MKDSEFLVLVCSTCGHRAGEFLRERKCLSESEVPCVTFPDERCTRFVTDGDVQAAADVLGWIRDPFTTCPACQKAGKGKG